MITSVTKVLELPDLRYKVFITVALLILFRLLARVPVMSFDRARMEELIKEDQYVFAWEVGSGGALSGLSVLSLGLAPYYAAAFFLGTFGGELPRLRGLAERWSDEYQRVLARYRSYLMLPFGVLQVVVLFGYLRREGVVEGFILKQGGLLGAIARVVALVAGACFVHWLAEVISDQGVGDGGAILVFGGSTARLPVLMRDLFRESVIVVAFVLVALCIALFVAVVVSEGERRIPVHYGRRLRPQALKIYGGAQTYLPIKVNRVGTAPLQVSLGFVSSLAFLAIPVADLQISWISRPAAAIVRLLKGPPAFWVLYVLGTILYALLMQDIYFEGHDLASRLLRQGGWVVGIRPGRRTGEYLEVVSDRIGMVGVLYLGAMALFPYVVGVLTGVGTAVFDAALAALLGFDTVLDTMRQLEAQLVMRHYVSFIK